MISPILAVADCSFRRSAFVSDKVNYEKSALSSAKGERRQG
ncbi:hypothetical protein BRCON_0485 [Candidatus Sumerlaea chitinivorans]|uniref:Uncharacterized protein n=1 Tax=Sumerlaea chitinivorans TaxID=2250252 RepID=A0A2Z4Y3F0_SUMC1|nr:hypothetical protein BRCON_0485 [Candidatus Sumerlaea chitinivorans]